MTFSPPSSIGDIVTIVTLIVKIFQALDDSRGASNDYRDFIDELDAFRAALLAVDETPYPENYAQHIKRETERCHRLMQNFLKSIEGYEVVGKRGWNSLWRKIIWSFFKTTEVAKFRMKLSRHQQTISVFLHTVTIKGVLTVQNQIPQQMRYNLENVVRLIDAYGETTVLPIQYCFSPERFHELLMFHYRETSGQDLVEQHSYVISSKDNNLVVRPRQCTRLEWDTLVKEGETIIMSMVIITVELQAVERTCPMCFKTEVGVMPDEGRFQCRQCQRHFGYAERLDSEYGSDTQVASMKEFRYLQLVPSLAKTGLTKIQSPQWLLNAMQTMQARYPNNKFKVILRKVNASSTPEWRIKCLDCPGKFYYSGPGKTLSNFAVHPKNRQHRQHVNNRLFSEEAVTAVADLFATADAATTAKP